MKLSGKTICFLGDSITEGHCASSAEKNYVNRVKELCGFAQALNYGISGTRIARQQHPSENPLFDQDFCSRISKIDPTVDIIVVFGGTNDHGHGDAPFGRDSDRTPDTFLGACHYLFSKLKEQFPGSQVLILTPLHRLDEDTSKGCEGMQLRDYARAIRSCVETYKLPVLDLFETSMINHRLSELTADGLHPNDAGHDILAREISAFLEKM